MKHTGDMEMTELNSRDDDIGLMERTKTVNNGTDLNNGQPLTGIEVVETKLKSRDEKDTLMELTETFNHLGTEVDLNNGMTRPVEVLTCQRKWRPS